MDRAQRNAVNDTMGDAIRWAKQNHARVQPGWQNRTANAEGSIQIVQTAVSDGLGWTGQWGSKGVIYFAFLEFERGEVLQNAAKVTYPDVANKVRYFYGRG